MTPSLSTSLAGPRVRFAPSPTGFLHVGSARTFIFNWLYAQRNSGTMILRLDDTDVERNTEASVTSIFEGLKWLNLPWDEEYKQSERGPLHRQMAQAIFDKGLAYRDFTPAHTGDNERSGVQGTWLFNPGMRELSRAESDLRAAAGEPFALRFRVPRGDHSDPMSGQQMLGQRPKPAPSGVEGAVRFAEGKLSVHFTDAVYGEQIKAAADIEDFALLRSDGMPTYHLASCADDADLRISNIIRGQDHLTNTFKHVLIFEAAGVTPPQFAHLPLLVAPDGTKLSKRRHGPVVSVTTYRDAGFLPEAFINFLCLLGWSPKNDREKMTREELIEAFSLEGINRANAVVNFKESAALDSVGRTRPERESKGPSPANPSGVTTSSTSAAERRHSLAQRVSAGSAEAKEERVPSGTAPPGQRLANNISPEDTFDPKALWLNAEHIRALPVEDLSARLLPIVHEAGFNIPPEKMFQITPLIRERIKLLGEVLTAADFFFVDQLPPYDPAELIPQKGDMALARKVLEKAREVLAKTEFKHDPLDQALRAAAQELGIKAGQMFQPIRVAVCGRKNAPPLFETLEVLGRVPTLARIERAIEVAQ
jgi:glutamyl/glutaminyl-tRNA synthetase